MTDHLVKRTLDDLYWVMSYSRWKDPQFWPSFRDALLRQHPKLTEQGLAAAQQYNFQRYYYQGIGRYEPGEVYQRGIADLEAISSLLRDSPYLFGREPRSADAGLYGFIANIYFYDIETQLKAFVASSTRPCTALYSHARQSWLMRVLLIPPKVCPSGRRTRPR